MIGSGRPPRRPATPATPQALERLVADARRARDERERGYRAQALKLFPPVCARCGRAFEGPRLRELTVHHKDHDHDHNPPDGSNWELLCVYCHDNEHSREIDSAGRDDRSKSEPGAPATHHPFADLRDRLKRGG